MTPTDFQGIALAWIGALVVVVMALLAAYTKIFPLIAELKTAHAENDKAIALTAQQSDQNTARLNGQSAKIDALQLAAPGPEAAESTTVNAPAADVVNIAPAADTPTPALPTTAPTPPTPAPATVNVTILPGASLDAATTAAAHAAIDAAAANTAVGNGKAGQEGQIPILPEPIPRPGPELVPTPGLTAASQE